MLLADWREEFLAVCTESTSELALFSSLQSIAEDLGFKSCSYGIRLPLPISAPSFHLRSSYPKAWEDSYISNNYFFLDPTVRHALSTHLPLAWAAQDSVQDGPFWEEARMHGLSHGWCQSTSGRFGDIGQLSMVRSHGIISAKELAHQEHKLMWLTSLVHSTMRNFLLPERLPESQAGLTDREKEVLRWTASGKTYSEIGDILTIDARTVKFHIVNTLKKLNAANKAEAAVKATILGML